MHDRQCARITRAAEGTHDGGCLPRSPELRRHRYSSPAPVPTNRQATTGATRYGSCWRPRRSFAAVHAVSRSARPRPQRPTRASWPSPAEVRRADPRRLAGGANTAWIRARVVSLASYRTRTLPVSTLTSTLRTPDVPRSSVASAETRAASPRRPRTWKRARPGRSDNTVVDETARIDDDGPARPRRAVRAEAARAAPRATCRRAYPLASATRTGMMWVAANSMMMSPTPGRSGLDRVC